MEYFVKEFSDLTTKEFYELVKLRIAVFVVEQTCFYQEVDDYDETAIHTWLQEGTDIVGYTRIYPKADGTVTFGRVLIHPHYRGQKLGNRLVENTLKVTADCYPNRDIVIGAQAHLVDFYGSFGFKPISDIYLEDDIPHIDMKKASAESL
ncbi:GNAT family N-acetyltransferase [Enterococcus sp. LJL99]